MITKRAPRAAHPLRSSAPHNAPAPDLACREGGAGGSRLMRLGKLWLKKGGKQYAVN